MKYDPERHVDPAAWDAADEAERMNAVVQYHQRKKIRMPSLQAHAAIHTAVENQIAMGDSFPAKATLARLMREGLDRHDAVHALGSVVSGEIYRMLKEKTPCDRAEYALKLERLTAESWRKQFEDFEAED